MATPRYPSLYQINTRVWLTELSAALGRPATLDDIPDAELDRLAEMGFDWVWLLSVWQTGPAAQQVSRSNPEWRQRVQETLPDLREEDIAGSGFAITGYTRASRPRRRRGAGPPARAAPAARPEADARLRAQPHGARPSLGRGPPRVLRPRHASSTWPARRRTTPGSSGSGGDLLLAYGRDPYFAGWPDTLQLNYGNPATQEAMIGELLRIAGQCDGVRCDMAMLVLPEVFERTWGIAAAAVLADGDAAGARAASRASASWPRSTGTSNGRCSSRASTTPTTSGCTTGCARATPGRCASISTPGSTTRTSWPASWRTTTSRGRRRRSRRTCTRPPPSSRFSRPGLRFFHQGQFEGRKKRISPHLGRAPDEPVDDELQAVLRPPAAVLRQPAVRDGQWQIARVRARLGRQLDLGRFPRFRLAGRRRRARSWSP